MSNNLYNVDIYTQVEQPLNPIPIFYEIISCDEAFLIPHSQIN